MAMKYAERVQESSTTAGTGDFTLAGGLAGFRLFSAELVVGDQCGYFIEAVDASGIPTGAYEVGIGTYSAANTLTRTTVIRSSNANALVNFAAGTKRVGISLLAYEQWQTLKLAADYTQATATFANITDGTQALVWTPPANVDWELEANLLVWTTAIANLPRVGFNVVLGAAAGMGGVNIWQAGATAAASVHANAAWNNPGAAVVAQIAAGGVLTASVPYICEVKAAGRSGATPTALSLQMACETAAAATCYIKRGSSMKYRVII